jgi:1,4-alpha-glucan branching enzyme
LLLAQASDWAFMMNAGTMVEYASRRTRGHLSRLLKLLGDAEADRIDEAWLSTIEMQDNIFPEIDYRCFA